MINKNVTNSETTDQPFIFGKSNYRILLLSIAVVVFGFILMIGETDIYSTQKIIIAPITVLIGFGIGFWAILKKPTTK